MTKTTTALFAVLALVGCKEKKLEPMKTGGPLYISAQKISADAEGLALLQKMAPVYLHAPNVELSHGWPIHNNGVAIRIDGDMTLHSTNDGNSAIYIEGTNTIHLHVDTISSHGSTAVKYMQPSANLTNYGLTNPIWRVKHGLPPLTNAP